MLSLICNLILPGDRLGDDVMAHVGHEPGIKAVRRAASLGDGGGEPRHKVAGIAKYSGEAINLDVVAEDVAELTPVNFNSFAGGKGQTQ